LPSVCGTKRYRPNFSTVHLWRWFLIYRCSVQSRSSKVTRMNL
jgi:hypothetical protein